jgi:ABC-type antimicrobial peptide transport system permease subunit
MLLLNTVRKEVQSLDKDQPVSRPLTLEEVVGMETVQPRFNMALFSLFAGLGLALAAIGIFSVLSYTVARRTHEIGIRMALGAERADVLRMVLSSGGKVVFGGLALGLAGSYVISRFIRSEYFAVPNADALGLVAVVALLCGAAVIACVVPARRAAKVDPMVALRHE